jgi:hypothetical protein
MAKDTRTIIAIDPAPTKSGYVIWDCQEERVLAFDILDNMKMLNLLINEKIDSMMTLAIEWIQSYGKPVGKEVFETCRWCGRFEQAWWGDPIYITREQVKMAICMTANAKDTNVRQALLDLIGPQGTKKAPGPTYGIKKDEWAALALAITACRRIREGNA